MTDLTSHPTRQYIDNEMRAIEEDFHKTFYMLLGNAVVFKELLPILVKRSNITKDRKANNYAIQLKRTIENFVFLAEQVEHHYKVESKHGKENYKAMHADIAKVIGTTLANLSFERYDNLASLLISFSQGTHIEIEEHLLDSLLDYEQPQTLEGMGLIQRYCPHLTVDEKEEMAKDLVKWSDMRQMAKI